MFKINPLTTNRRVLTFLSMCPIDEPVSKWKQLGYRAITGLVITLNFCGSLSSILFFAKFISSDFEMSLHALLQICAYSSAAYMGVTGIVLRHKITAIFGHLMQIYQADSGKDTYQFLEEANVNSERITKKYLLFVVAGFFVNTVTMSGVSVIICRMLKGTFDPEHVYHPFQVLLPWDKTTQTGYFYEVSFDAAIGAAYLFANASLLLLFISICLHHEQFANRLSHSLRKLDHNDKERNAKNILHELIEFHISIKDWFWQTAEVYSLVIFIQLACMTVYSACVAFQLDIQIRNFSFGIIIILISVMVGVSNLFLYCYFGKVATENFAKMANSLYEANWPDIPVELQKYFVLMIANAQIQLHYHGFNVAILNLETFTKLMKTVFTYYMLFKTLTTE